MRNTIPALLLSEHVWWEILDGRFGAVDGKVIIIASSSRFAAGSVRCLAVIVGFGEGLQRITLVVDASLVVNIQSANGVILNKNNN